MAGPRELGEECRVRRSLLAVSLGAVLAWSAPGAVAQDIDELFRKISSAVVVIKAKGRDVTSARGLVTFSEIGSGVLVSADGKVMTAAHVVHAMDEITVEFFGGETVPARVIASEPAADLSMLRLTRVPAGVRPAQLADSDRVRVGQQVLVIGAPYGLAHSFSAGWISARWPPNTAYRAMPLAEFFQTTATINTGNSGGPMFNMAGEVIGIVSHNISRSGGSDGLGFVVTMKSVRYFLMEREWAWIGLEGTVLTGELAEIFNVPGGSGLLLGIVPRDSPAWEMGLLGGDRTATIGGQEIVVRGDIVLSMAGIPIRSEADIPTIRERIGAMKTGEPFKASILRAGKVIELSGKAP
jgi:S1-C subfamily serine protease